MSDRTHTVDVAVLGAGPAGVATACALRRLGHTVTLFGRGRQRALEGVSVRALALLENYGPVSYTHLTLPTKRIV